MNKKTWGKIGAVLFALIVWEVASLIINKEYLLASPLQTIARVCTLFTETDFLKTILFSFLRMTAGFLLAFLLGVILAIAASQMKWLEYLLWPFVVSIKSVPVASFIILFLLWMNFNQLTIFIALLIVFPVIYGNVLQGIKNTDEKLLEVAAIYHVPFSRRLLYMYVPAFKPFLLSAASIGVGMAWKAGVAAEVIGVVEGSIGGKLQEAKVLLLNADLLAWTVIIILLSVISEKLISALLRLIFRRIEKQ